MEGSGNRQGSDGQRTRNNLQASLGDGAAFGAMVGSGETFLPAFALAAGLGEVIAGLIASVPLAVGGILQLISLRVASFFGNDKRWVVCCASLQAWVFIALAAVAWYDVVSTPLLMGLASLYWASGLAAGPAWNTWIGTMVPASVRARFFGFRTLLCQASTLLGLVAGGLMLQWGDQYASSAFAIPFLFAAAMRFLSVALLGAHYVPARPFGDAKRTRSHAAGGVGTSGRRLILYLVLTQGMVQLVGPYITPLMLHHLQLSYGMYVVLTGIAFASKVVALRIWPTLASRHGAAWLLRVGGAGLVAIPLMWLISWNAYWLMLTQAATGFLTAAYELGFMLMFFETLPASRRTRVLTWYNAANTSAWCLGSALGAAWLHWAGSTSSSYMVLLGVSAIGRAATLGLVYQLPNLQGLRVRLPGLRVLSVRPGSASIEAPVATSVELAPALEYESKIDSQGPMIRDGQRSAA